MSTMEQLLPQDLSCLPTSYDSLAHLAELQPFRQERLVSTNGLRWEKNLSNVSLPKPTTWKPPPSPWKAQLHPLAEPIGRKVERYFLDNWDFRNEKARETFLKAGFSRVTCLYFPMAESDRIGCACRLLTILFLIDGVMPLGPPARSANANASLSSDMLEHLSLVDGQAFNEKLMPIMQGAVLLNRERPEEYIMYDLWAEMRSIDPKLAEATLQPTFVFMRAQTDKKRLSLTKLGEYFDYRERDVGKALLSALMRFTMALDLSPDELESLSPLDRLCGRHISIVNDILSWEKELRASQQGHVEGAVLCSAVKVLADETHLTIEASKRILWSITREIERAFEEGVATLQTNPYGASSQAVAYLRGLQYQMSGNEAWSVTTKRYSEVE